MHLKVPSAKVVCCRYLSTSFAYVIEGTSSVDPDQTALVGAPTGAVKSGSTL